MGTILIRIIVTMIPDDMTAPVDNDDDENDNINGNNIMAAIHVVITETQIIREMMLAIT